MAGQKRYRLKKLLDVLDQKIYFKKTWAFYYSTCSFYVKKKKKENFEC